MLMFVLSIVKFKVQGPYLCILFKYEEKTYYLSLTLEVPISSFLTWLEVNLDRSWQKINWMQHLKNTVEVALIINL